MTTFYKQLLVHLDAGRRPAEALACARRLAAGQGAALAALHVLPPALGSLPPMGALDPAAAEAIVQLAQARRHEIRLVFDKHFGDAGPGVQFAQLSELPMHAGFVRQAFHADLLVLSQPHPETGPGEAPADFNEGVLAGSGKPALILPAVGPVPEHFHTVVVAWKPTREAARAVASAMPLLQRARQVHVVEWTRHPEQPAPLDLERHLALYGVPVRWHRHGEEPPDAGELLLSETFDLGADLLVMGCYGHARAREWLLGGMSRTVLRSMTLPVLMAH